MTAQRAKSPVRSMIGHALSSLKSWVGVVAMMVTLTGVALPTFWSASPPWLRGTLIFLACFLWVVSAWYRAELALRDVKGRPIIRVTTSEGGQGGQGGLLGGGGGGGGGGPFGGAGGAGGSFYFGSFPSSSD